MDFKIVKADIKWRFNLTPLNPQRIDSIGLHHMAHLTADIPTIHGWHLQRDPDKNGVGTWEGFAYNYWIGRNGEIFEGRGLHQACAVGGRNNHIISIGFQGAYEPDDRFECHKSMPDIQFNAGVWLINYLRNLVPTVKQVEGHSFWSGTACPGKYFPLAEMKRGLYRGMSLRRMHTVVLNETLGHIAIKYGTTVKSLVSINNISNPDLIMVGQVLYIDPAPAPAPAPTVAELNAIIAQKNQEISGLKTLLGQRDVVIKDLNKEATTYLEKLLKIKTIATSI